MNEQILLQQAIAAARAGRKTQARELFQQVIALNRYHELAWLWLGGVMDDLDAQIQCLENVLVINPDNAAARKGLAQLRARALTPEQKASPYREDSPAQTTTACPHCGAPNRADARFCKSCGQNLMLQHLPSPPAGRGSVSKTWPGQKVPHAIGATPVSPSQAQGPTAEAPPPSSGRTGPGAFVMAILAYLLTAIPIGIALGFAGAAIAREMGYPKVTHYLFKTKIEPIPPEIQFLTLTLANWISIALAGIVVAKKRLGGSRKAVTLNCLIAGVGYVLLSIALQPELSEWIEMEIINTTVSYIEFALGPIIGALAAWLAFRPTDKK